MIKVHAEIGNSFLDIAQENDVDLEGTHDISR